MIRHAAFSRVENIVQFGKHSIHIELAGGQLGTTYEPTSTVTTKRYANKIMSANARNSVWKLVVEPLNCEYHEFDRQNSKLTAEVTGLAVTTFEIVGCAPLMHGSRYIPI